MEPVTRAIVVVGDLMIPTAAMRMPIDHNKAMLPTISPIFPRLWLRKLLNMALCPAVRLRLQHNTIHNPMAVRTRNSRGITTTAAMAMADMAMDTARGPVAGMIIIIGEMAPTAVVDDISESW